VREGKGEGSDPGYTVPGIMFLSQFLRNRQVTSLPDDIRRPDGFTLGTLQSRPRWPTLMPNTHRRRDSTVELTQFTIIVNWVNLEIISCTAELLRLVTSDDIKSERLKSR